MKNVLLVLFILSHYSILIAQIAQDWLKKYEGTGSHIFYSVAQTKDNNYIVAGKFYSDLNRSENYIVLKFNQNGDEIWKRTSPDSLYDQARVIIEDNQGNYVIGGSRSDFALFLKYNSIGDTLWTKQINIYPYSLDQIRNIQQMSDSTYVVVGVADGDMMNHTDKIWVMRADYNGNTIWSNTYSSANNSYPYAAGISAVVLNQEEILVVNGAKVLKIDISGNLIWEKSYNLDEFSVIKKTKDNSFILTGSVSECCYKDVYIIKIDSSGNKIWDKRYGGGWEEIGKDIIELKDGCYFILGKAPSNEYGGSSKIWLLKTDSEGDTLWTEKISVSEDEFSSAYPESFVLDDLENPVIVGMTTTSGIGTISFILKLSVLETSLDNEKINTYPTDYFLSQNFPNPFNPRTSIEYQVPITSDISITILNQLGQNIATLINQRQPAGKYKFTWNAKDYPSGIYYYNFKINNELKTVKKMILLK